VAHYASRAPARAGERLARKNHEKAESTSSLRARKLAMSSSIRLFRDFCGPAVAGPNRAKAGAFAHTKNNNASPNTSAPTKKLITVNPITRRKLIPAIAKTGNAQNGWIMLVTCSPMATAIAVAAWET